MKNRVFSRAISIIVLLTLVTSCKTSNDVVSNKLIQKRKYRSGFYVNNDKKAKVKKDELLISNEEILFTDEVFAKNDSDLEPFLEIENNQIKKLRKEKEAKKVSSLNSDDGLGISSNKASKKATKFDKKLQQLKKNKSAFEDGDDPPKKKLEIFGLVSFILAIAGLVSVIFAIVLGGPGIIAFLVFELVALILSIASLNNFKNSPDNYSGKTFALAGLWISVISLIAAAVLVLLYALAYS